MMTGGYESRYSEHFQDQLLALTGPVYGRVRNTIVHLEAMPDMGRAYEPEYEADEPPVACRFKIVPDTTKCLYFAVDDEARVLRFFHLGDTRQDPRSVFVGLHPGDV